MGKNNIIRCELLIDYICGACQKANSFLYDFTGNRSDGCTYSIYGVGIGQHHWDDESYVTVQHICKHCNNKRDLKVIRD